MITPLHVGYYPFELVPALNNVTPVIGIAEVDTLAATAVKDRLSVFLLEFFVRGVYVEAVVIG